MGDMADIILDMAMQAEGELEVFEHRWRKGIHVDQNGKKWKLEEMTDSHLKNTIRYFKEMSGGMMDVSSLQEELKKRKNVSQ